MYITSWIRRNRQLIVRRIRKSSQAVLLILLTFLVLLNLKRIPSASNKLSNQSQLPDLPPRICLGREKYKEWINALFDFAPPAPNCTDVEAFVSHYKETSPQWVYGAIILQRNENYTDIEGNKTSASPYHDAFEIMDSETRKPASGERKGFFTKIWRDANRYRKLPPNLEIILYVNDKPRVNTAINKLPVFVIAGSFPAGSGPPDHWLGYVPFPSHFFEWGPNDTPPNRQEFSQKRPMVYFRGQFSEMAWIRYNKSGEFLSTPRFKLANATKHVSDRDVLDIALTGFGAVHSTEQGYIRQDLLEKFGIEMGEYVSASDGNAMMSLSVPGNGWPGATTMRALISDTAMLKVVDESIDNEGYNRNMGEIYFPLLEPNVHFISVEYESIATTARELINETETLFNVSLAAHEFAQRYLGYECALDMVELLAWRYFEYVQSGCAAAFSHVQM